MVISGQASEWASVTSGVPQGSILGPLLFLLYVNDIGAEIHSHTRLFADDVPSLGRLAQVLTWKLFKMTYIGSTNDRGNGS